MGKNPDINENTTVLLGNVKRVESFETKQMIESIFNMSCLSEVLIRMHTKVSTCLDLINVHLYQLPLGCKGMAKLGWSAVEKETIRS